MGVTGGIAAYKIPMLIRLFKKNGCEVQVIMTPSSERFVTPETLSVLSERQVLCDFFDPSTGMWNNHVDWGLWADALFIAPATATTIGKMVQGIADNLMLATYLSAPDFRYEGNLLSGRNHNNQLLAHCLAVPVYPAWYHAAGHASATLPQNRSGA